MATEDDVRRIGASLPVPQPAVLAVRVTGQAENYFTAAHVNHFEAQ